MNFLSSLDNIIFLNLLFLTITYWISLIYPNKRFFNTLNSYGTIFVNFLIFLLLGTRWLEFGYFPLSNLYESLFFLAWGITLFVIIICGQSKLPFLGAIGIPVALFVTGFASLSLPESMQAPAPLVPALKSNWLMLHVSVMMISYASLLCGSLLSIFFLILKRVKNIPSKNSSNNLPLTTAFYKLETDGQYNVILATENDQNSKTFSTSITINRLSLFESIDNLSYRTIGFGFPLLTIGIIAGAVWANEAWGSYWSWDPKETWALITWIVFAAYLHTRLTKNWQGERPAMIASIGFIVVWICYLGVNFLGKGLHTYGQLF